ncbi:VOC family protein [Streptomyces sp. M19]
MAAFTEGAPCWVDAMLPDLEAGKRFYGELFGWTFGPSEPGYGYYTQAFLDGENVAALAPKPDGRMPTVWNVHFATRDAHAAASRIRAAGGQVIMDPTRLGDFGTALTAVDPGGAVFGGWQAGSHQGFERHGIPGSFGWIEVYTRAPEAVDTFYREVFGYGMAPATGLGDVDFVEWWPEGEPTETEGRVAFGGRGVIDASAPAALPSHFLTYFAVADCDEAAWRSYGSAAGHCTRPKIRPTGDSRFLRTIRAPTSPSSTPRRPGTGPRRARRSRPRPGTARVEQVGDLMRIRR